MKKETPNVVQEPVVAYQAESKHKPTPYVMESLRRAEEDYKAGRVYTEEEMDKFLEKWLSWKFVGQKMQEANLAGCLTTMMYEMVMTNIAVR